MENAEMVALDAVEDAPTLFVVLTTKDPRITREDVKGHLKQTWKAVRVVWPDAEYACFVEFTTGLSIWSGGHRRIHLNLLVKGVHEADELREVLTGSWCRRTSTTQLHVGPIYAAEGLVRYVTNLALHVMKEGQKPPESYAGHLVRWSRGYFAEGATSMRSRARRSLKVKRRIYRGEDATTAELEVAAAELDDWQLKPINPNSPSTADLRPSAAARVAAVAHTVERGDARSLTSWPRDCEQLPAGGDAPTGAPLAGASMQARGDP